MTVHAWSSRENDTLTDTAEIEQVAASLVKERPELAEPANLLRFNAALNEQVALIVETEKNASCASNEVRKASKFTSFATSVSGAASAGLIAAAIAPSASVLVVGAFALAGLLGSTVAARYLDRR
jgi:hypothetical protein